ncbi:MAG: short-chain fatty acid transporter [Chitinophagales bacterium]
MKFFTTYTDFFRKYFPSPFTIALVLTVFTFGLVLFFTAPSEGILTYVPTVGQYWFDGVFNTKLLAFMVQMMLILVFGHIIALSRPFQRLIDFALRFCKDSASAAFTITLLTIIIALFNWGLGLVFGAIFARKIGEHFQQNNKPLNYALIAAAAYSGLMVWHGGLSGSAPLTVAGDSHSLIAELGVIPMSLTVFSPMNIVVSILLIVLLPTAMYFIAKKSSAESIPSLPMVKDEGGKQAVFPAEKLEANQLTGILFGGFLFLLFVYLCVKQVQATGDFFSVLNLSRTNLLLFSLALIFHQNISSFLKAVENAISDVSGILIQFPLYFGIMGMMQSSGFASQIATVMTVTATEFTLPIYTYISAGIVNIFVPSGGGQWQVQGPIIAETAKITGTSVSKLVMALTYGDQLTNMLQPFWALPILGITGLKAKDILPYTLFLFLLGGFIFLLGLLIF